MILGKANRYVVEKSSPAGAEEKLHARDGNRGRTQLLRLCHACGDIGLWWTTLDPLSCNRSELAKSMFVVCIAYQVVAEIIACGSPVKRLQFRHVPPGTGDTYQSVKLPVPGGSAKNRPSAVDFGRRQPIEGEIDRRRSIEGEIATDALRCRCSRLSLPLSPTDESDDLRSFLPLSLYMQFLPLSRERTASSFATEGRPM
ncbi:hypothetical protein GW17_00040149, partial [Ensete ventricosum]